MLMCSDRDRAAGFFHLWNTWWRFTQLPGLPTHFDASIYSLALHAASATDQFIICRRNVIWKNVPFFFFNWTFTWISIICSRMKRIDTLKLRMSSTRHSTLCFHTMKLHPTNGCGLAYESEAHSQRRGDGEQIIDVMVWNTPAEWQQAPARHESNWDAAIAKPSRIAGYSHEKMLRNATLSIRH